LKKTFIAFTSIIIATTGIGITASQARGVVTDKVVKEECSACHMAYPAGFLPAESWKTIMGNLDNHFGGDASLDDQTVQHITDYLVKNASRRIRFKKGQPPLRISKLRWFVRQHKWEVSRRAKKRAGTMSNCTACHSGADKGYFGDD